MILKKEKFYYIYLMVQIRYVYAFLALIIATAKGFAQTTSYDPNRLYAIDSLKSDIHFLKQKMESIHPDLYRYISKSAFETFFDSLDQTIDHPMK